MLSQRYTNISAGKVGGHFSMATGMEDNAFGKHGLVRQNRFEWPGCTTQYQQARIAMAALNLFEQIKHRLGAVLLT